jgi:hypothetical protein
LRRAVLGLACVIALLSGCVSTTPAPPPASTGSIVVTTAAPVASEPATSELRDAVSKVLPGSAASPCTGTSSDATFRRARGCPITARLEERVHTSALAGINPMCRCQSTAPTEFATATTTPAGGRVQVRFRTPTPYIVTFALVREGPDWRVDDTWCDESESTTIYATPVRSCGG